MRAGIRARRRVVHFDLDAFEARIVLKRLSWPTRR
jgi:hypothetical protein